MCHMKTAIWALLIEVGFARPGRVCNFLPPHQWALWALWAHCEPGIPKIPTSMFAGASLGPERKDIDSVCSLGIIDITQFGANINEKGEETSKKKIQYPKKSALEAWKIAQECFSRHPIWIGFNLVKPRLKEKSKQLQLYSFFMLPMGTPQLPQY